MPPRLMMPLLMLMPPLAPARVSRRRLILFRRYLCLLSPCCYFDDTFRLFFFAALMLLPDVDTLRCQMVEYDADAMRHLLTRCLRFFAAITLFFSPCHAILMRDAVSPADSDAADEPLSAAAAVADDTPLIFAAFSICCLRHAAFDAVFDIFHAATITPPPMPLPPLPSRFAMTMPLRH